MKKRKKSGVVKVKKTRIHRTAKVPRRKAAKHKTVKAKTVSIIISKPKRAKTAKKKIRNVKAISHEPIIIKEGVSMKGKKVSRKRTRKHYGFEGMAGSRKRRTHKARRRHYMGANPTSAAMDNLKNALIVGTGAVVGSMIGRLVPVSDTRIKAGVPLALGIILPMVAKNKLIQSLALGLTTIGVVSMVKTFAPNIALLGVDEPMLITADQAKLLGLPISGVEGDQGINVTDMAGVPMEGDFQSPASIM